MQKHLQTLILPGAQRSVENLVTNPPVSLVDRQVQTSVDSGAYGNVEDFASKLQKSLPSGWTSIRGGRDEEKTFFVVRAEVGERRRKVGENAKVDAEKVKTRKATSKTKKTVATSSSSSVTSTSSTSTPYNVTRYISLIASTQPNSDLIDKVSASVVTYSRLQAISRFISESWISKSQPRTILRDFSEILKLPTLDKGTSKEDGGYLNLRSMQQSNSKPGKLRSRHSQTSVFDWPISASVTAAADLLHIVREFLPSSWVALEEEEEEAAAEEEEAAAVDDVCDGSLNVRERRFVSILKAKQIGDDYFVADHFCSLKLRKQDRQVVENRSDRRTQDADFVVQMSFSSVENLVNWFGEEVVERLASQSQSPNFTFIHILDMLFGGGGRGGEEDEIANGEEGTVNGKCVLNDEGNTGEEEDEALVGSEGNNKTKEGDPAEGDPQQKEDDIVILEMDDVLKEKYREGCNRQRKRRRLDREKSSENIRQDVHSDGKEDWGVQAEEAMEAEGEEEDGEEENLLLFADEEDYFEADEEEEAKLREKILMEDVVSEPNLAETPHRKRDKLDNIRADKSAVASDPREGDGPVVAVVREEESMVNMTKDASKSSAELSIDVVDSPRIVSSTTHVDKKTSTPTRRISRSFADEEREGVRSLRNDTNSINPLQLEHTRVRDISLVSRRTRTQQKQEQKQEQKPRKKSLLGDGDLNLRNVLLDDDDFRMIRCAFCEQEFESKRIFMKHKKDFHSREKLQEEEEEEEPLTPAGSRESPLTRAKEPPVTPADNKSSVTENSYPVVLQAEGPLVTRTDQNSVNEVLTGNERSVKVKKYGKVAVKTKPEKERKVEKEKTRRGKEAADQKNFRVKPQGAVKNKVKSKAIQERSNSRKRKITNENEVLKGGKTKNLCADSSSTSTIRKGDSRGDISSESYVKRKEEFPNKVYVCSPSESAKSDHATSEDRNLGIDKSEKGECSSTKLSPSESTKSTCKTREKSLEVSVNKESNNKEKPPFDCHICGKVFSRKCIRAQHLLRHEKSAQYQCPRCPYKTYTKFVLRQHVSRHEKSPSYQCPSCPYKTFSKNELNRHDSYKHGRLMRHRCEKCEKKFMTRGLLADHMNKHDNVMMYKCDEPGCNKEYTSSNSLLRHKTYHDLLIDDSGERILVKCSECPKKYDSHFSLRNHCKTHVIERIDAAILRGEDVTHMAKDYNIKCDSCPRVFLNKERLNSHKKQHHYFKCYSCRFEFATEEDLKGHFASDSAKLDGNPKFCKLGGMDENKSIHYSCDSCFSKFDSSWMLHLHQRVVHAKGKRGIGARAKQMASADGGEEVAKRTFPCSLCDFKGLSKGKLLWHQTTQHAKELSQSLRKRPNSRGFARACYVKGCNDIFTSEQALAVHLRANHPALFSRPNNNRVYRDNTYDEALLLRSATDGQPLYVLQEVVDEEELILDGEPGPEVIGEGGFSGGLSVGGDGGSYAGGVGGGGDFASGVALGGGGSVSRDQELRLYESEPHSLKNAYGAEATILHFNENTTEIQPVDIDMGLQLPTGLNDQLDQDGVKELPVQLAINNQKLLVSRDSQVASDKNGNSSMIKPFLTYPQLVPISDAFTLDSSAQPNTTFLPYEETYFVIDDSSSISDVTALFKATSDGFQIVHSNDSVG